MRTKKRARATCQQNGISRGAGVHKRLRICCAKVGAWRGARHLKFHKHSAGQRGQVERWGLGCRWGIPGAWWCRGVRAAPTQWQACTSMVGTTSSSSGGGKQSTQCTRIMACGCSAFPSHSRTHAVSDHASLASPHKQQRPAPNSTADAAGREAAAAAAAALTGLTHILVLVL